MNIDEMFENHRYKEIVEVYYSKVLDYGFRNNNAERYVKQIRATKYVIDACYRLGYYINVLKVIGHVRQKISINDLLLGNNEKWFYEVYFECLIYCKTNRLNYDDFCIANLDDEINRIINDKLNKENERNLDLITVYNDFMSGKLPYYIVSFWTPYEPLFEDYQFDLRGCFPFEYMKVSKTLQDSNDANSKVYTKYEFKKYGFVHTDSTWGGPEWIKDDYEEKVEFKNCLKLTNMMLLYASNAVPGSFTPIICVEQLSTMEVHQFTSGGKEINGVWYWDFDAQWVGLNAPRYEYSIENLSYINNWLIQTYGCDSFVQLYQQAKNNMSAGLYVESFLLLCTCVESLVYYYCDRILGMIGKKKEYDIFSDTKKSICADCSLNINGEITADNGHLPTLFDHVRFFCKEANIDSSVRDEILDLIKNIRNDTLRNDVVHGRTGNVRLKDVKTSIECIMKLQEVFLEIEKMRFIKM